LRVPKYYDFVDRPPAVGKLVIIEGTETLLAERALASILDRLLPPDVRDLNLDLFDGTDHEQLSKIADAIAAMPFLAERRVTVVRRVHEMRAQPRRDLWEVAQTVPEGNTLILEDLVSPAKKSKPEPMGALAGRTALRIDTTANAAIRERFINETLAELGAKAQARVIGSLAESEAELAAIRTDLEKLALGGKTITFADLERESLAIEDPKAYRYASALVAGRADEALAIAFDMFEGDPRGAAIPLISALATEFGLIWELTRPHGELPARHRWRERVLRPLASRIGERKARFGYERAVRGFEAIVTGRIDEPRLAVELLTAEIAGRIGRA
jgi:DNA polymerase III delta subunit